MMVDKILILGNGPSLKEENFNFFSNIPCLGMNAAYRYWENISWYPEVYCCLDDQVVVSHAHAIAHMIRNGLCKHFFLHQNILLHYPEFANQANVFFLPQLRKGEKNLKICSELGLKHTPVGFFETTNGRKLTTGSYAVRFAAFLGFNKIGLIGIDCRYQEIIKEAKIVDGIVLEIEKTPAKNPNYFFDDYQLSGDRYNIPNPEVHQGNLHLQAFEVLRDDIEHFKFDFTISVCTKESELYEKSVFPFMPLKNFIKGPHLSAIFTPFVKKDIVSLIRNLKLWGQREFAPFQILPDLPNVELHFAYNQNLDASVKELFINTFNQSGLYRFFSGIFFDSSNLEGLRDLYTREHDGDYGPEGYMAGPNNQFFDIIQKFSNSMSHVLLMEADAIPIRKNWLGVVEQMIASSERFWICGSQYRGIAKIKYTYHLNGNAIYNVGDPEFQAFFKNTFLPHFYNLIQSNPGIPYDIIMHDLYVPVYTGKANPDTYKLWQNTAHLFRFAEFIVDLSAKDDINSTDKHTLVTARKLFPNTYIMHGAVDNLIDANCCKPADDEKTIANENTSFSKMGARRVLVIDPDGESTVGHYLSYNDNLQKALNDLNINVDILCNNNIDKAILKSRQNYFPELSIKTYYVSVTERNENYLRTAYKELELFWKKYIVDKGHESLTIYMYVGSFQYLEMLQQITSELPNVRIVINLFRLSYIRLDTEYIKPWLNLIRKCNADQKNFSLTVPTKELQIDLYNLTQIQFPIAPHPSTTFNDQEFNPKQERQVTSFKDGRKFKVLFPGLPRFEKGYQDTFKAIRYLHQFHNEIVCTLRHVIWQGTPKDLAVLPDDISEKCNIINGNLNLDEFKDMFYNHDVVVLPYDENSFKNRTSGLLIDSLYAGLPVIALKGTWLGRIISENKCGVVIDSIAEDYVYHALCEIRDNYDFYIDKVRLARLSIFSNNQWKHLAESILGISKPTEDLVIKTTDQKIRATSVKNEKILIIGNGPSARALAEFGFHNIPQHFDTFGMVGAYRYFEKINWWPTYYGLADRKVVFHHSTELARIINDINVPTKKYFLSWKVTENPKLVVIDHSSTGSFCLQKAISLGYTEIYLIGMEGRYVEEITESRPLTKKEFKDYGFKVLNLNKEERKLRIITSTPLENPNYFFPDYQREGDIYSLPQSHTHQKNWITAASDALSKNVKIFNLSNQSEIDVFDKLDFNYFTDNVINNEAEIIIPERDNKVLTRVSDKIRNVSFKWKGIVSRGDVIQTNNSYKIHPPSNHNWIASVYDGQINAGDHISCLVRFSVDHDCNLKIVLCRDGNTFFESQTKIVNISGGNHSFEIVHRFKGYHLGLRIQIGSESGSVTIKDFDSEIRIHGDHFNTGITNAKFASAKDLISANGLPKEQTSATTLPNLHHLAYLSFTKLKPLIDFLFPVNSKRRKLIRNVKNSLMTNSK